MAAEKAPRSRETSLLLGAGIALGLSIALGGQQTAKHTSSNAFCTEACHAHQESTERWIKSTHYSNKRGVVASCVECHLPPEGAGFLVAKVRLGARDLYGTLFKDVSKMDWEIRRTVEAAATFTYDESCVQCHENLFPEGLSKKQPGSELEYRDGAEKLREMAIVARRMEAHQYYLRNTERLRCINCHLGAGHSISPREEWESSTASTSTPPRRDLRDQRKETFEKILRTYEVITIEKMARLLNYDDEIELERWLLERALSNVHGLYRRGQSSLSVPARCR